MQGSVALSRAEEEAAADATDEGSSERPPPPTTTTTEGERTTPSRRSALALTAKATKTKVEKAAEQFNAKPRLGLKALQEYQLLSDPLDAEEIAIFLRETAQLDKAVVGDYLSGPEAFNAAVLKHFVSSFDFGSMSIDAALRVFLQSFRLPGEAQKIDRVMEAFAQALFAANPGPFKSADAAFVLAFSIIMLNTDRHNAGVVNKMTCDEFIRNNRGINANTDLPSDFLRSIFQSIDSNEIRMLGLKEEIKLSRAGWRLLSSSGDQSDPLALDDSKPDQALSAALLELLLEPTVDALGRIVHAASLEPAHEATIAAATDALDGLLVCARCAASGSSPPVLDGLIKRSASFTALLPANAAPSTARGAPGGARGAAGGGDAPVLTPAAAWRQHPTARRATSVVFRIAREHGHMLRDGWREVVRIIAALDALKLLPAELSADTQLAAHPTSPPPLPSIVDTKRSQSSFSLTGLVGYLIGSGSSDKAAENEELLAQEQGRAEVAAFAIPELFHETAFLPRAPLFALIAALLSESGLQSASAPCAAEAPAEAPACPAKPTRDGEARGDGAAPLAMQLLAEVGLRNRDRFGLIWKEVEPAFTAALNSPRPQVIHAAVVAMMRLCLRLALRDGSLDTVLPTLEPALSRLPSATLDQASAGLLQLVQVRGALQGCSATSWRVLLGVAAAAGRSESSTASMRALDALRLLAAESSYMKRDSVMLFVEALQAHAKAPAAPAARCTEAIDLISETQTTLTRIAGLEVAEPTGADAGKNGSPRVDSDRSVWLGLWLPWLRTLSTLCLDTKGVVRDHAVVALQRALLHAEVKSLEPSIWAIAFEKVVFPWMSELLHREHKGQIDDERLKRRAVTLLSKSFLHHLQPLLTLPDFHLLWLRALELLEQFMKSPNNELLLEAVPETLKNMLLVMGTSGAFDAGDSASEGGRGLSTVTKSVIDGFCPGLCDGCDLASLWAPAVASPVVPPTEEATAPADAVAANQGSVQTVPEEPAS